MIRQTINLIILLILNISILDNSVQARMKCWTNNEGVKECGDTVPPEYTQQGYKELSKEGIVKDETKRVKTKEELEKEREKARAVAKEKEKVRKKQTHDKMLLETYNTIDDINDAKEQKIQAIESTIKYNKKRIIKLQYMIDNEEKSDADNQTLKQQIAENEKYIEYKINEQKEIEKTYFEYITRFKELKGLDYLSKTTSFNNTPLNF